MIRGVGGFLASYGSWQARRGVRVGVFAAWGLSGQPTGVGSFLGWIVFRLPRAGRAGNRAKSASSGPNIPGDFWGMRSPDNVWF